MSEDLDDDAEVFVGGTLNYTSKYHRVADCPMLEQNHSDSRPVAVGKLRPQHNPCQHPDCWGERDPDEPTCPLCGEPVYGAGMPGHIQECASGDEPGVSGDV